MWDQINDSWFFLRNPCRVVISNILETLLRLGIYKKITTGVESEKETATEPTDDRNVDKIKE